MTINEKFNGFLLNENVRDKHILKAVFVTGGPHSGKDWYMKNTLHDHGLVEIPLDNALKHIKNLQVGSKHSKVTNTTDLKHKLAIIGRNGLLINGQAEDHEKVSELKNHLENIGYDTSMALVHTTNEASSQRNIERARNGGKSQDENVRRQKWENSHSARTVYAKMFGPNYTEYDNSKDLRNATPEEVKDEKDTLRQHKELHKTFLSSPPTNENGLKWIEDQTKSYHSLKTNKNNKMPAPGNSDAHIKAVNMGLKYHGKGKYGSADKITHYTLNGELKPVPKKKEEVNESFNGFLRESIFSDELSILSLGKNVEVVGEKQEEILVTNSDVALLKEGIDEYKRPESDKMMRSASAAQDTLLQKNSITSSGESNEMDQFSKKREKLTLNTFKKKLANESIDKGIEPGLSMASSGENLNRDSDKKGSRIKKQTPL